MKSNNLAVLYRNFHDAYKNAHVSVNYSILDLTVAKLWNELKASENFPQNAYEQINVWKEKSAKNRTTLLHFWNSVPKKTVKEEPTENEPVRVDVVEESNQVADVSEDGKKFKTPAQDDLRRKISNLKHDILYLSNKKESGLATDDQLKTLSEKKAKLKSLERSLKNLILTLERQRNKRRREKEVLMQNPELAKQLARKKTKGKPRLEEEQPELLKAIVNIATYGSATDQRRRSEVIRTVKTLDQLKFELETIGYKLSRSALYLRLLPKRSDTLEGKRHVATVPVRLIRATNDAHKFHADTEFCRASIAYLEEIASVLGRKEVIFISQDDKARVPIGITAANKQAPILMHMEYRVRLPDHDWVVAERHKLIPSVYALMNIESSSCSLDIGNRKAVGYTGPTFIAIRSGKHSSSTALSHSKDLDTLLNLNEALGFTRMDSGEIKPVLMLTVDGGPDENPRYEKVINCAIRHFLKYDLDAIFVATNAPGRSAFNRVERRMAPLSKELAGLILPHDTFGTHLDEHGKTVDVDLEKKNFRQAGLALAEIWSNVVLDGYETIATYVNPEDSEISAVEPQSAEWKVRHVREAHYFLQVVKCGNRNCCSAPRGNYFKLFSQFVPAPLCVTPNTITLNENSDQNNQFPSLFLRLRLNDSEFINNSGEVPFDLCCTSVQELISSRVCNKCGVYFASVKSLRLHKKWCINNPTLDSSSFSCERISRPIRIAARRQKERMVIWTSRLNDEHCDWFDEEEVSSVSELSIEDKGTDEIPIVDYEAHLEQLWENITKEN